MVGRCINVRVAWWLIALGMLMGAVLGLWSFGQPMAPPTGFAGYDDVPRRLLRLAHIAMIALPLLNFEFLRVVQTTGMAPQQQVRLSQAMLFGMVALPTLLAAAAIFRPALYLLGVPVGALLFGVFTVAISISRARSGGGS